MGKTKTFGTANDSGVPEVEFNLAKIVQNAKARGLTWTKETAYRFSNGKATHDCDFVDGIAKCCAVGAAWLEPDTKELNVDTDANDMGFAGLVQHWKGKDGYLMDHELLGLGFRLAMR